MAHYNPRIYRVEEENSHRFYQMPKELFTNEKYKGLSSDAKILYTILLDRKELSRKNGWVDEHGQIYLIYTREHIGEMLNATDKTVTKAFKQLRDAELISEERQGLNKPNKIYIWRLDYSPQTLGNQGTGKFPTQEPENFRPSDTDSSDTEITNNVCKQTAVLVSNPRELEKVIEQEPATIIQRYAEEYKEVLNRKHPNLKREQVERIAEVISDITVAHGLSPGDWEDLITSYFAEGSIGDGNMNRFFSGNGLEGVIAGMLG